MHKTTPITAIPISLKEILTLAEKMVTDKTVNGADLGNLKTNSPNTWTQVKFFRLTLAEQRST